MKKSVFLLLSAGIVFTTHNVSAYEQSIHDGCEKNQQPSVCSEQRNGKELEKAIERKQINYWKERNRDRYSRNLYNQRWQHNVGKIKNNVNERSTYMFRDGELNTVPLYEKRRHTSEKNISAPNNPKRNFRVRAIDYYIDGGDANAEPLENNVIYGSTHRVRRVPIRLYRGQVGQINKEVRDGQRFIGRDPKIPTGYQKQAERRAPFGRTYINPYIRSTNYFDESSDYDRFIDVPQGNNREASTE